MHCEMGLDCFGEFLDKLPSQHCYFAAQLLHTHNFYAYRLPAQFLGFVCWVDETTFFPMMPRCNGCLTICHLLREVIAAALTTCADVACYGIAV